MNKLTSIVQLWEPVVWMGGRYSDSAGTFGSFLSWAEAGSGPPLHVHEGEDEAIHIIEGAADFWLDGQTTRVEAGQGILLPRGVPHTFRVTADSPARMLTALVPGGFEGFFQAAAVAGVGPHDPGALQALADGFRLRILGRSPLAS